MLLINLLTFLSYILFTTATPANSKLLQTFLDCLKFNNATNYGIAVENNGYLLLTPINPNTYTNRKPFVICGKMFDLGFHLRFSDHHHNFHNSKNLKDIETVTGDQLVEMGAVSRDIENPEMNHIMEDILSTSDSGVIKLNTVYTLFRKSPF